MALFFIFHATNIAILCYICVNGVLNVVMGNHFFEKMAGIFGGRNESDFFSVKGEAPLSEWYQASGQEAGQEAGQALG